MFDDSYLEMVYKGGFLVLGLTINQFVLFNMSTKTLKRPYFGYNHFFVIAHKFAHRFSRCDSSIPRYLPQLKGPCWGKNKSSTISNYSGMERDVLTLSIKPGARQDLSQTLLRANVSSAIFPRF
jgi:hypothetical protein